MAPRRKPKGTTVAGFVNGNKQGNLGRREPVEAGTDHGQYVYDLQCGKCGHRYGANGSDIWQRKCPQCGGGAAGL